MPYNNYILDAGNFLSIKHYKRGMNNKKILHELTRRYELEWESGKHRCECGNTEACNEFYENVFQFMKKPWDMTKTDLYKYYNIIPYKPCWMLNISPNWKQERLLNDSKAFTDKKIAFVRRVMRFFTDDAQRFTRVRYVMEGGKEGNFLHIHAVFELNDKKPNNISHLKKGNFLKSFRTIWDRCAVSEKHSSQWEGLVGSKYALQTTYLTSQEMLNDKLDYLIEAKKPISHQNHDSFESILVDEWD